MFRRARIGIDGTAFGDWDYRILLDLGGSGVENAGQVYETWVQYSGFKPFKFRVGAFSPSLGLDDQASTSSMPFLERAAISDMVRGLAAGDTRTAVQAFAGGDHWLANVAVTGRTIGVIPSGSSVVLTSTPSSTAAVAVNVGPQQTYGDQLGVTARLAATPIHGSDYLVHVGVNASDVLSPPNTVGPAANNGSTALNAKVRRPQQHPGTAGRRHQADQHRQHQRQERRQRDGGVRRPEAELPAAGRILQPAHRPFGRLLQPQLQGLLRLRHLDPDRRAPHL